MIVSATKMLKKAKEGGYAIAHININNLEWTRLILEVVEEQKAPVIIGVSEGAIKYMGGYTVVANMVRNLHDSLGITVPVAIHLDHGTYEGAVASIKAGFSSVMYDGSSLPFEENYKNTRDILKLAKKHKVSLEAEVGGIGGEEDGVTSNGEVANPEEAKKMADLGIQILAAGIGNIHGKYPKDWKGLNFDVLAAVEKATSGLPLVLHGGSGISEDQVKKAISLGICKVNVNTELQLAFASGIRKYIEEGNDLKGKGFDPRKILKAGVVKAKDVVREKLEMFGSVNKA